MLTMDWYFIPFYCWKVFHYVEMPQFVYLGYVSVVSLFHNFNTASINIHVQVVGGCVFSFLLARYVAMHIINSYLTF